MHLITDGVGYVASRSDQKRQRLPLAVPGTLEHGVKEFPIGLSVQFIEDHPVSVETMPVRYIRRQ